MKRSLVGFGRGLVGGIISGLGLNALGDAIKSVGDIGDLARDLGISTDALQTFQKAIQLAGGRSQDITKAIANMQDELSDTNSVLSRFARDNNLDTAKMSVEELFTAILKLSQGLPAEDRLRLFRDGLKLKPGTALDLAEAATHVEEAGKAARISAEDIAKLDKLTEDMTAGFQQAGVVFANFLGEMTDTGKAETAIQGLVNAFDALLTDIKLVITALKEIDAWGESHGFSKNLSPFGGDPFSDLRKLHKLLTGESGTPGTQGPNIPLQTIKRGDVTGGGYTGTATALLKSRASVDASRIETLDPDFARRLANAVAAAELATGAKASIISARRTNEEQAAIYARAGGPRQLFAAARPGHSLHEAGRAVDMSAGPVRDWIQANAAEFGLAPASARRGWRYDPPHVQMGGGPAGVGHVVPPLTKDQIAAEKTAAEERAKILEESNKFSQESTKILQDRKKALDDYISSQEIERQMQVAVHNGDTARIAELKAIQEARQQNITIGSAEYNQILAQTKANEGLTASFEQQAKAQEELAQIGSALESATTNFVDALLNGESASKALQGALKSLASDLLHMAIHNIFAALFPQPGQAAGAGAGGGIGSLFGFQHGGQFRVGGAGGTDSSLVAFRATPGEEVTVTPRRLAGTRGSGGVTMGGTIINIEGSADERTVEMMDRRIAANNHRQRKALERDWGSMSARYQQLRG